MQKKQINNSENHRWYVIARDPEKSDDVIDTNEYLLVSDDEIIMFDPGGTEVFPQIVRAVAEVVDVSKIEHFFCSHQDPDIMSSLPLWMGLCPKAKIYIPWMWMGFIAHFGHEYVKNFIPIPDEGMDIEFRNGARLEVIPAHYCHSPGNYSVYDPKAGVLFSGDIGAALLPEKESDLFVQNFRKHTSYMEGFHQRWMPSNQAKNHWIQSVRKLNVQFLCPQHGSIFKGQDVTAFYDWFEQLNVGTGIKTGL
jgi:flavorubredoxin